MVIKQWEQILGLKQPLKTQMRVPVKEHDRAMVEDVIAREDIRALADRYYSLWPKGMPFPYTPGYRFRESLRHPNDEVYKVYACGTTDRPGWRRCRFEVGKTYAVQPATNKKAVGRTPPIRAIRREGLGDISVEDVFAEGLGIYNPFGDEWYPVTCLDVAQEMYANLWNSTYGADAWDRMKDDDVWVLDFSPGDGK